jgi:hypothetical protein
MLDVAAAFAQRCNLRCVDVDPEHRKAFGVKPNGQRKPDVTKAYNSDGRSPGLDPTQEVDGNIGERCHRHLVNLT